MKLIHFEYLNAYCFELTFENGDKKQADLKDLISQYVTLDELNTARIDREWGCLEFKCGIVDIEPKTLYAFVTTYHNQQAA